LERLFMVVTVRKLELVGYRQRFTGRIASFKGEKKMSPKSRKWLLIGGGVVIGLCVLGLLGSALLNIQAMGSPASGGAPERAALQQEANYGYGGGDDYAYDEAEEVPAGAPVEPGEAPLPSTVGSADATTSQQLADRLIIRNGSITVAVDDTLASRKAIEDMVAQMAGEGAFIVSVDERGSSSDTDPYINMSIRVPAARFDEVMNQIAGMASKGTTPTQSQSAEDVTNQYVDLDARLETLEAARLRLLEIMAEAQSAEDLLYAEQQLTQREAEIASIKGQMQYLSQSAALSSISISLQPYILSQPVDDTWRPAETVRRAWEALLSSLRGFGDLAIIVGIAILPWLVVIGLVVFGIVRFVRWRTRKTQAMRQIIPPEE
jgi:hypothetical protein